LATCFRVRAAQGAQDESCRACRSHVAPRNTNMTLGQHRADAVVQAPRFEGCGQVHDGKYQSGRNGCGRHRRAELGARPTRRHFSRPVLGDTRVAKVPCRPSKSQSSSVFPRCCRTHRCQSWRRWWCCSWLRRGVVRRRAQDVAGPPGRAAGRMLLKSVRGGPLRRRFVGVWVRRGTSRPVRACFRAMASRGRHVDAARPARRCGSGHRR